MKREDEIRLLDVLQNLTDSVTAIGESLTGLTEIVKILDGRITRLERK